MIKTNTPTSKLNTSADLKPRKIKIQDRRDAYNRQTHTSTGQPIAPKDRIPYYK